MGHKLVRHDDWREDLIQIDLDRPVGPQPVLARMIKTTPTRLRRLSD